MKAYIEEQKCEAKFGEQGGGLTFLDKANAVRAKREASKEEADNGANVGEAAGEDNKETTGQ